MSTVFTKFHHYVPLHDHYSSDGKLRAEIVENISEIGLGFTEKRCP